MLPGFLVHFMLKYAASLVLLLLCCVMLQLFIASLPASLLHLLLFLAHHLFFPLFFDGFCSATRHYTTLKQNLTSLPRRNFSDNLNVFYLKLSHYKASCDCRQFTPVCLAVAWNPRFSLFITALFFTPPYVINF